MVLDTRADGVVSAFLETGIGFESESAYEVYRIPVAVHFSVAMFNCESCGCSRLGGSKLGSVRENVD